MLLQTVKGPPRKHHILDMSYVLLAGAPIVMFVNNYAGELPIRKTCNFDKPLNRISKVMGGCMHIFCLVSIISMLEFQLSPFFNDSLHNCTILGDKICGVDVLLNAANSGKCVT